MIDYNEWLNAWRYYCSLVSEFENTIQYVDDATDENGNLCNGKTFSNEFYKILFRAASEFENMGKIVCNDITGNNCKDYNIVRISRCILQKYPNIVDTQFYTPSGKIIKPIEKWRIVEKNGSPSVDGMNWWSVYNDVKHNRYINLQSANLQNCFDAISSLLVLELYAGRSTLNEEFIIEISTNTGAYFRNDYYRDIIIPHPQELPDEELFEEMKKD